MNESHVTHKLGASLRALGYWPITQTDATKTQCSRCGTWVMAYPPKGRPDIIVMHPSSISVVVEAKVLKYPRNKSFSLKQINEDQRDWLDGWLSAGGLGYIGLGVISSRNRRDVLDGMYLIDWLAWKELENQLDGIQGSIPLNLDNARKAVRERGISIVDSLRPWRMTHKSGDYWQLPDFHTALP